MHHSMQQCSSPRRFPFNIFQCFAGDSGNGSWWCSLGRTGLWAGNSNGVGNGALFTYFHFTSSIEIMKLPLYSRTVASQEKVRNKEQYVSRLQDRDPKTNNILTCQTCQTNLQMSCHCHSSTILHLWIWRRSFSRQTQMATVFGTKLSRSRCLNATSSYCFVRMSCQRSSRSKKWMMPAAIRSCSLPHLMFVCYVIQCAHQHVCVYRAGFKTT